MGTLGMKHMELALLFVDLKGFSSMCKNVEPEHIIDLLEAYYDVVGKSAEKYDGMINKYIGDRVMVTFNMPFTLEDYIEKACAAHIDL